MQNAAPKLTIEYMPVSVRYSNARSHLSLKTWDLVRRECYKQANYKCEICGGRGNKLPVECHEMFEYNARTKVQTLVRLIALCPMCHFVKHLDIHQDRGADISQALAHLQNVNKWSKERLHQYLNDSEKEAESYLYTSGWKLDLIHVQEMGHLLHAKDHAPIKRGVHTNEQLPSSRALSPHGKRQIEARVYSRQEIIKRRGGRT